MVNKDVYYTEARNAGVNFCSENQQSLRGIAYVQCVRWMVELCELGGVGWNQPISHRNSPELVPVTDQNTKILPTVASLGQAHRGSVSGRDEKPIGFWKKV